MAANSAPQQSESLTIEHALHQVAQHLDSVQ